MKYVSRPVPLSEKRGGGARYVATGIILALIVLAVVFDLWFKDNYFVVNISGSSMENTIADGDYIYARLNKNGETPSRGTIVIIDVANFHLYFSGKYIIKRVVAVGGDSIYCANGVLYRRNAGETDYVPLDEPYALGRTRDFSEVTVGEGCFFFLGDNREESLDGRRSGPLPISAIAGFVSDFAVSVRSASTAWESFRSEINRFLSQLFV